MALPTTNLTAHFDAADTDNVFVNEDSGGAHNGVPSDNQTIQCWDDEDDGISDICLQCELGFLQPKYRSTGSLMLHGAIEFNEDGMRLENQNGSATRAASTIVGAGAKTMALAFYPNDILTNIVDPWNNETWLGDHGAFFGLYTKLVSGTTPTLIAHNWDGSNDIVTLPITVDQSHVAIYRHDGTNLFLSLDGGGESSTASGNTTDLSAYLNVGDRDGNYVNGQIGEFAIYNAALTGTPLTDLYNYFAAKWLGITTAKARPIFSGQRKRVWAGRN